MMMIHDDDDGDVLLLVRVLLQGGKHNVCNL